MARGVATLVQSLGRREGCILKIHGQAFFSELYQLSQLSYYLSHAGAAGREQIGDSRPRLAPLV